MGDKSKGKLPNLKSWFIVFNESLKCTTHLRGCCFLQQKLSKKSCYEKRKWLWHYGLGPYAKKSNMVPFSRSPVTCVVTSEYPMGMLVERFHQIGIALQDQVIIGLGNGLSLVRRQPVTHWGRDKMAVISQTTFSNAFSWMKMYDFRLIFHWSLFPRVE